LLQESGRSACARLADQPKNLAAGLQLTIEGSRSARDRNHPLQLLP
jgi:hypothetical protein